jgi:hypothetical protein
MTDIRIIEIIFGIGLSAITYFLKLIHADLRAVIGRVQKQETSLAVGENKFGELERRIESLEERINTMQQ